MPVARVCRERLVIDYSTFNIQIFLTLYVLRCFLAAFKSSSLVPGSE